MIKRKGLASSIKRRLAFKKARRNHNVTHPIPQKTMPTELSFRQRLTLTRRRIFFTNQDAMWSAFEEQRLDVAVRSSSPDDWRAVAQFFDCKTATECRERYIHLYWTKDEDTELRHLIGVWEARQSCEAEKPTTGDASCDMGAGATIWRYVSLHLENKDEAQCFDRWVFLSWSAEEDTVLRQAVATCGRSQWWHVASWLKTKADWQCKERWAELNGTTSSVGS